LYSSKLKFDNLKKAFKKPSINTKSALVILALIIIFSAALLMRIFPAKYGFYLNEFDPYFDYYGTNFIVDHFDQKGITGISDYFSWTDTKSWYPEGRDVASTSQVGLQLAAAILFIISRDFFGLHISLYDFLVLFPAIIGALTALVTFLLVKKIAGTSGGLLAALIIAFSPPIIVRGNLGWFKSEPFALFLTILASYLFLSIYDKKINYIGIIWRGALSGFLLGYANTAWGGSWYFGIVFGAIFIITPFLNVNLKKAVFAETLIVSFALIFSSIFPRPGPSIISGPYGAFLLFSLFFTMASLIIKTYSEPKNYIKILYKSLISFLFISITVLGFGAISGVSGRYLTVIFPFQRTSDPLVESVAEHFIPTGAQYLSSYFVLIPLSILGAWILFKRKTVNSAYALVFGIAGVYIASSFSRLMVYSSFAFAILAGVAFAELISLFFKSNQIFIKRKKIYESRGNIKLFFAVILIIFISFPVIYPSGSTWVSSADIPVSIVNSGTAFNYDLPDWREALEWMRTNTDPESVFAAWWDYGYWITVMGNRTSLADNATINSTRIAQLGRMFMSDEEKAVDILHKLDADYVVIFVVGQRIQTSEGITLYFLGGGGDESKKQWFISISKIGDISQYLYNDEFTPKPNFWNNTLIGKMIPFEPLFYIDNEGNQYDEYQSGSAEIYAYRMKYPDDGEGPLRLAFASSSISETSQLPIFAGILIYKIE
jgi:dolichyl-diphosphooligosaccharide--protein glycosyltransferase